MKLIILENSMPSISPETEEFVRQLGISNVTIYSYRREIYKSSFLFDYIKDYEEEEFIRVQSENDAIYITKSGDGLTGTYKIPYFYNIYSNTYVSDLNYNKFQKIYHQIKGASGVFVNDKKINRFANWMGLNSYFVNKPLDTKKNKFIRNRKFYTPKLNIGFITSSKHFGGSERNRIVEDMWVSAKNNWILHVPDSLDLNIDSKNVVTHDVFSSDFFDYSEIYKNCHVIINPEKFTHKDIDYSYADYSFEAMSTGCVSISPNENGSNSDYYFDKVHYFKLDFVDSNTLLDTLRYVDKRREKLSRMSKMGSDFVKKYMDLIFIVQQKIQIIKNNI